MRKLKAAIAAKRERDPKFTGTTYAISRLCKGVSHQMVENLLAGTTPPWNVRVSTQQELCRVFKGRGLKPTDFYRPAA